MYDFNIANFEMDSFVAEMAELDRVNYIPTEEEMEEMARWYGEE